GLPARPRWKGSRSYAVLKVGDLSVYDFTAPDGDSGILLRNASAAPGLLDEFIKITESRRNRRD
ncbi:hypothetical protein, partial [Rothia mucilaginosa]